MHKVKVIKRGILLDKTDLNFENEGVLNPAVIKNGQHIHLFYRAVSKGNISSLGYCLLASPLVVEKRMETPVLVSTHDYEKQGMEDPRIVKINDLYFLSYTAYDGANAIGALATSTDLKNWHKHGVILPQVTYEHFKSTLALRTHGVDRYAEFNTYPPEQSQADNKKLLWDKNLVFFPRRIKQQLYFLHRIKPDIQLVGGIHALSELTDEFWEEYLNNFSEHIVLRSKHAHERSYVGAGCPPIETADGWLLIYHAVSHSAAGYVYSCCAALLDLEDPAIEIGRLPYPLFSPEEDYEKLGYVNNVCFPSGAIVEGDTLYIYYGAADERIAVASTSIQDLLTALKHTDSSPLSI